MKRLFTSLAVVAALCAVHIAPAPAYADSEKEYIVKAAFIYNFVKFVAWPGELAMGKQSNVNICVLGDNPFTDGSLDVFQRASTNKLQLWVLNLHDTAKVGSCHILFITRSQEAHLNELLGSLKTSPILTVSDIPQFAQRGGMMEFFVQDGKVKLIINSTAVTNAGLRADAQLLEIASQVMR